MRHAHQIDQERQLRTSLFLAARSNNWAGAHRALMTLFRVYRLRLPLVEARWEQLRLVMQEPDERKRKKGKM